MAHVQCLNGDQANMPQLPQALAPRNTFYCSPGRFSPLAGWGSHCFGKGKAHLIMVHKVNISMVWTMLKFDLPSPKGALSARQIH